MRSAILRWYPANAQFHRLTLLDLDRRRIAKVKCTCGKIRRVPFNFVKSGHCKSCGCLRRDKARDQINLNRPKVSATLKHGGCSDPTLKPLYAVYRRMLARCLNPNADGYKNWGGRNITVCRRWRDKDHGFENWLKDMQPRPKGFWLERINNDGSYTKRNCKWETPKVQRQNQRPRRKA